MRRRLSENGVGHHAEPYTMAIVKIRIPQVLRHHCRERRSVDVEADTVHGALEALFAAYPPMRDSLTPRSGDILEATNLFLNDSDINELGGLNAMAKDGDTLTILPAMSGGVAP